MGLGDNEGTKGLGGTGRGWGTWGDKEVMEDRTGAGNRVGTEGPGEGWETQ